MKWWLWAGLGTVAAANTEAVVIDATGCDHRDADSNVEILSGSIQSQVAPVQFENVTKRWKLVGSGKYQVRLCWPASHPGSFKVTAEGCEIKVTYDPDYYSHLLEDPIEVPYELIADPLVFGIPHSVVGTIGLVAVGAVSSYFLVDPILEYIL
uniref:ARAD1B05610p n=1 Tax=Blastobotrys adeninivorans TaxID=409370 RepID=A0A060T5N6_BLAAD